MKTKEEILRVFSEAIQEIMGLETVSSTATYGELGTDSLHDVEIIMWAEESLGSEIEDTWAETIKPEMTIEQIAQSYLEYTS